jgi:predicted Zn-ribbon and HTH transcriptional regulator
MKPRPPTVPPAHAETIRRQIAALLEGRELTAREISTEIGIPERAVFPHLEHLRRSLHQQRQQFRLTPAACRRCGFLFAKRERLERPGRCPVCRGQSISEPRFTID